MPKPLIYTINTDRVPKAAGALLVEMLSESVGPSLLLLSGGSAISSYQPLATAIQTGQIDTVTIGLVDERYGNVGHAESNAWQIEQTTGLSRICSQRNLEFKPVLQDGLNLEQTTSSYAEWVKEKFVTYGRRIAILGIGTDGHTAGIMPMAEDVFMQTFETGRLVEGYSTSYGQHQQRITVTPEALLDCTDIVVVATGAAKRAVLRQALLDSPLPRYHFPSTLLRDCQNVHVYTDVQLT